MKALSLLNIFILVTILRGPALAATRQEAEAALASAKQAETEAGKLGNRWAPAEAMLKAAQAALDAQDWEKAVAAAAEAGALAQRAIAQSKEQDTAWRDAVIR
jgi:hypothetical protein